MSAAAWIPNSKKSARAMWRSQWVPHPRQTVTEWAEDNITFSSRFTSSPGPFRVRSYPYMREWLDAFHPASGVRSMALLCGAQVAKSTAIQVGMAYRLVRAPAPALWVLDTQTNAQSFSESRWQVMIDDNEILRQEVPRNRDKFKNLDQAFARMHLWFIGSNSPGNLAGRSISLLCLDEVDKYKTKTKQEAAAVQLAVQRVASFPMHLIVQTSTPTTTEGSIWKAWKEGDQRRFWLPCPHCSKETLLMWPMMKWDDAAKLEDGTWDLKRVRETARLECPHCSGHITDSHKTKMLRAGEWRAENPNALPGYRSYHLSALYSVRRSFGALAVKFLQDKQSLLGLQDFVNSILAEPWEEGIADEEQPIQFGEYRLREPAEEGEVRVMGVDVQLDHFWFVCRAFKKDGSSRLVDEGRLQLWEDVEAKVQELGCDTIRTVGHARCKLVVVDYGYRAAEIYERCLANRYLPAKGEERAHYPIKVGETVRRATSIVRPYRKGWIHMLWSSQLTQDILDWLRSGKGPSWTVAGDVSDSYKRQLNSHRKVTKRSHLTGRETAFWKRRGKQDDHMLDCECMITALADFGGLFKSQKPDTADI